MRRAVVVVFVAGCSSGPTCLLPDVISERVGNQELHDCGTSSWNMPIGDLQVVQGCVIDQQTAMAPFRAVHDGLGDDGGQPALAYVGITEGGTWKEFLVDADGAYDNPTAQTFACPTGLSEITPCDDATMRYTLCLSCDNKVVASTCP